MADAGLAALQLAPLPVNRLGCYGSTTVWWASRIRPSDTQRSGGIYQFVVRPTNVV